jgi:DNA-binding CsgD family transcriptional regulator
MIAGLLTKDQEFFYTPENGLHHKLSNGALKSSDGLCATFIGILAVALATDADANKGLDLLNITSQEDRIAKFYHCNYSAADDHPDVYENGTLGPREFVKCAERGNCLAECLLCKPPHGETKKELRVLEQIGAGKVDKEICDALCITQNTLRTHKDHISAKADLNRKPQLALLADKLNLI